MKTISLLVALVACVAQTAMASGLLLVERVIPVDSVPGTHVRFLPPPATGAALEVGYLKAEVQVRDQVAMTTVEQEFINPSGARLEGTFLFPVPRGAKLNKLKMDVNGKEMEAELLGADRARQIYEEIVRKSRDPALLEYVGRDLYKVRIFPIEPNSKKKVTVVYTQLLKSESGLASYQFPLNTQKYSAKPLKNVSVTMTIKTARPLKALYCPTHSVEIRRKGANEATIGFEGRELKPDADMQVFFSQDSDELGGSMLTYRTSTEGGYFMFLASPGVGENTRKVTAKDVAFVLDTSGSMAGPKLAQAKKALAFCVENLNPDDRFEVMRFATDVEPIFGGLTEATRENRDKAQEFIKNLGPIGGTAIDSALEKAMALRPESGERPYVIIFLTDGLPTVGVTDMNQILSHVKERSKQTRIFCFGIGHDVNTHLLDQITDQTRAASQYVLPEEDIEVKVSNFFAKIKAPAMTEPKLEFPASVHASLLYPTELPDLFKGDQLVVFGRYTGSGKGRVVIKGKVGGEAREFRVEVEFPEKAADHEFIPQLWALRRVGYLMDEIRFHGENKELKDEVVDLARKHGIVTPYTAYLIQEDETLRNVPVAAQSLPALSQDAVMRRMVTRSYSGMRMDQSGGAAVAGARLGNALKEARTLQEVDVASKSEAKRNLAYFDEKLATATPALSSVDGRVALSVAASPAPTGVAAASDRLVDNFASQTRNVGGKNFFQNGTQWIDSDFQKLKDARKVRLQFNSKEYFDLLAKEPMAAQYVALGRNVQFVLKNTQYEIYE